MKPRICYTKSHFIAIRRLEFLAILADKPVSFSLQIRENTDQVKFFGDLQKYSPTEGIISGIIPLRGAKGEKPL